MSVQGSRMSVPYFVNPDLNYVFQGPEKKFPPLSGFDLLAKTGNAYEARKNDPKGKWRKQAYGDSAAKGVKCCFYECFWDANLVTLIGSTTKKLGTLQEPGVFSRFRVAADFFFSVVMLHCLQLDSATCAITQVLMTCACLPLVQ